MRRVRNGMPPLRAGVIGLVVVLLGTYLAFTKQIPFTPEREISAVFRTSNLVGERSPVRIAGVDVGKVVRVERYEDTDLAKVTMTLADDTAVHADATIKIRPRLFLEGNFFLDLRPGTPGAGALPDDGLIPLAQTSTPVQLDQLLTALQSDTRRGLQEAVKGFGDALGSEPSAADDARQAPAVRGLTGGEALSETLRTSPEALEGTALAFDGLLGQRSGDLTRTVRGFARTMRGLSEDEGRLADLVRDFNATTATFAARSDDVRATVGELAATVGAARPAFARLRAATPATRRFAQALTSSVPELPGAIEAARPWLAQAAPLLSRDELGGLLEQLRPATADLARLGEASRRWLPRIDAFDRCVVEVLLPTANLEVDDGELSAGVENYKEFWYAMVGQAGEGQAFDGNGSLLRLQGVSGPSLIKTGRTNYSKEAMFGKPVLPPLRTRPAYSNQLPPLRRDRPCHENPIPDVNGPASIGPADGSRPDAAAPDAAGVVGLGTQPSSLPQLSSRMGER
jgi:phospholipid/cholesterol/gamma-HCH transport system substrate-binding protein